MLVRTMEKPLLMLHQGKTHSVVQVVAVSSR